MDVTVPEGPVTECGSCGCRDLVRILDLGLQPLPQATVRRDPARYPLRLAECPHCTLIQLDYIVPQRLLFPVSYPYSTGNTAQLRDHFAGLASVVTEMTQAGDLVIDIGGNDGTFLRALRQAAPKLRGLLIEPTLQARAATAAGIRVIEDYFRSALAGKILGPYGQAAVIVTSNTFGHVPDPHDFLDGVTALLAPGGTLIIENQDWRNVVNGLQIDTVYHEHLRYYSPASLGHLLSAHDLLITSWRQLAMHGGSFRVMAVRRHPGSLQARAELLASRITRLVAHAARDGAVYAIGAPTRATPLVNFAGLSRYLTCACEITGSAKIGAFIPGTTIPVLDEKRLFADQPAHALLLAWDLADTIVPKLRAKGYKGKILVPLPEPEVLDD